MNTDPQDPIQPPSDAVAPSDAPATPASPPKRPLSEARLRANRQNAQSSTGPRTEKGKSRSALNATRHGILAQVIHLPEEEMASYDEFTAKYVADLSPVGHVEAQLANACADLQFRLHRLAAAEHNLFAIGHDENGNRWNTGHPESHSALTFAETVRRSKDPLATITLYETRLSRRFLQTLKQLRQMQAERRALEQSQLEEMYRIVSNHPGEVDAIAPAHLGFVCSLPDWKLYLKRRILLAAGQIGPRQPGSRRSTREIRRKAA